MDCIKQFLQDSYQSKLRMFAQGRSERYEETLDNYAKIFLIHLDLVKKESSTCMTCKSRKQCLRVRKQVNKIDPKEIEEFFNTIRTVYLEWINSKPIESLKNFEDLLKTRKLLGFTRTIKPQDVFFKARQTKEILTEFDMFHIPFNKRHLIQNQRYSITGQPMIYVGSSVIGVAEEIGTKQAEDFKISVVQLPNTNFKIYNLKNSSTDIFNDMTTSDFMGTKVVSYTEADFFKLILSSVCSFRKREELKGYSFCEEYVIPQILALILKRNKFNGISYFSTKRFEDVGFKTNTDDSLIRDERYKENIAIFTNLATKHVYDRKLFDKIKMSTPIDISKLDAIDIDDLQEITREISQSKNQNKISRSEVIFNSFKRIYSDMTINTVDYFKTEFGQLHMYELYLILNEILVS